MPKILCACLFVALLLPLQAFGAKAMVGLYGDGEAEVEVLALNAETMRVQVLENGQPSPDGYMLFENGRRWLVMVEGETAEAMDFVPLAALAERPDMGGVKLTDTGRVKTVGGVKGAVYEFDDNGDKGELVVSDDARVAVLSRGLVYFYQDINTMFFGMITGPGLFLEKLNPGRNKPYGILEFEGLGLRAIAEREVADDLFKLPPGVKIITTEEIMQE